MKVIFSVKKKSNLSKTNPDSYRKKLTQNGVRINKYIASAGYCSRRAADKLIEAGKVSINSKKAELGSQIFPGDVVRINGKVIEPQKKEDFVYLAFNKPQGIICTANPEVEKNIISYINYPERIFTIGRLDKDSEGLILLTNNGDIFNKIVRAEYEHEKEYVVEVDRPYGKKFLENMAQGVKILDTVTNPAKVEPISATTFKLIITQGLNRQIRRMCKALGYEVVFLQRIRIINISLNELPIGEYRNLSQQELTELFRIIDYKI
ncbi:MAG: pseudouridine synthase [Clostridiaceae bacterium]|nr:pseudouridine synthase [Clostridiaceae bacterium]